jgi:hypothetical protein
VKVGYFGGIGAGQGWHKLNVLPDFELLARLLDFPDTILYDGSAGVPKDKPFQTLDEILEAYGDLLRAWQAKEGDLWQYERKVRISLTTNQNHLEFVPSKDLDRVHVRPKTPHITFGSCTLWVDQNRRVSTAFVTGLWMGVQISYPRVFSEWTCGESVSTTDLPENDIFRQMVARAKSATKPLVLNVGEKKVRTAIRVSPSLLDAARTLASEFAIRQLAAM